jgi:hypothetical protein
MPSDEDYELLRKYVRAPHQGPRETDKATTPGPVDTRVSVVDWLSGLARIAFRRFKPAR